MSDDDFDPPPADAFRRRITLLDQLNALEDEYALRDNAAAVFAIMQAKSDLGYPVKRGGWST